MRAILVAIGLAASTLGAGCGKQAVRAAEKEFLADQVMGGRPAEGERGRRLEVDVRDTTDSVGAEQAWHG